MIAKGCIAIAFSPMPLIISSIVLSFYYPIFLPLTAIFFILQGFFIYFFRDVKRDIGEGIISPADGKVVYAEENRIGIFMSIFDMHINLSPYNGVIKKMIHIKGKHYPAYGDVSKNERMEIYMETDIGEIVVIQSCGIFARRIFPYIREGDFVKKGDKIGIIRFGSRADVILPKSHKIIVHKGEKIKAGETIAI